MRTLDDAEIKGATVLVRVDYNVPLAQGEDGAWYVASDLKIRSSLPTIRELRRRGAEKIILMSHLGRPEGRDESLSLRPVAEALAMIVAGGDDEGTFGATQGAMSGEGALLVDFVDETVGPEVQKAVAELKSGGILVLENLRFDPREESNDPEFARQIVEDTGATVFVEDGFGVTHRAHTSTVGVAKLLPAVAGLLVENEVKTLGKAMQDPDRPFAVVIGGAKVEDKAPLIEKVCGVADQILVGGKIAADFREGKIAPSVLAVTSDAAIYIANDFDEDAEGVKLDVGPLSAGEMMQRLSDARTVLWNGVLGKVEDPAFATASEMLAEYLGERPEITSIICGGDTSGFAQKMIENNPDLKFTLISTGGGATLTFLTGGKMPGLIVLE